VSLLDKCHTTRKRNAPLRAGNLRTKNVDLENKSLDLSSDCNEATPERELVKKNAVAPKSSGLQEG
jgi:hypothetical protein